MLPAAAWGMASLYRGTEVVGAVATTSGPTSGLWVSIEDVGALLGFSVSRSGEELQLARADTRLRVVMDAAAAWRDIYLVPLYGAPFERDGRIWMDAPSALALFQRAAGTGARNRLRFGAASDPSEVPVTPAAQPEAAPKAQPTKPAPPRQQAKYETFHPDSGTHKKSHPSLNGGEIQRLRWSTSQQRIRAVVDASDGADPEVRMQDGAIHALFASAAANPEGLPPPYENVKVEMRKQEDGVALVFTAKSTRVEKMVLDSPRRIVFDFFFPSDTRIRAVAPPPTPTPPVAQTPAQPKPQTQPQRPQPAGPPGQPRKGGRKLVAVDPGHGGKDPGASANNVREKDVNLAIGLALEQVLKSKGFDVVMTRRTDVYLKLQERTDIANKANADVFVSVHVNALPSAKRASGFEIYIMALPTDKDALELAKIENREFVEERAGNAEEVDRRTETLLRILGDMQQNNKINESTGLAEALFAAGKQNGIPMRRVAQAPFFVLRGAGMPAALLETGFVTNATEAKLLAHSGYQQRIAQAMAAGIENYLR